MRRSRRPASSSRTNPVLRGAIGQLINHPALTASVLAGSLLLVASHPASALTLGELTAHSTLGQRLNATVPVRLGPGEALSNGCVFPGFPSAGLSGVPGVEVHTPDAGREGSYVLQLSSTAALYEPMYALELRIDCPGVPAMVRQFVLMLDLPAATSAAAASTPAATLEPGQPAAITRPAATNRSSHAATSLPHATPTPIAPGSRYRVVRGDTLSSIAARVHDRPTSLWAFASAIQAANPEAFIHGDANLIKLGSDIMIPAATADDSRQPATAPATATPTAAAAPASSTATPEPLPAPVATPAPTSAPASVPASVPTETQAEAVVQSAAVAVPATAPAATLSAAKTPATPPAGVAAKAPVNVPDAAEPAGPNPFLAAGAGILFGLLISVLLWFRNRLPVHAKRPTTKAGDDAPAVDGISTSGSLGAIPVALPAALPAALDPHDEEPGFTVSWSEAPPEDLLAAEFADAPAELFQSPAAGDTDPGHFIADTAATAEYAPDQATLVSDDITSELEELFDSTDTTIQKRLNAEKLAAELAASENEKTVAVDALNDAGELFSVGHLDEQLSGNTVDFLIGELRKTDDAAENAPTVDQPRPVVGSPRHSQEPVDIHSLAAQISSDNKQAQTLLEALSLLERDYENELSASQVFDLSAVRDALGDEDDEPTRVRETQVTDRRQKAR